MALDISGLPRVDDTVTDDGEEGSGTSRGRSRISPHGHDLGDILMRKSGGK